MISKLRKRIKYSSRKKGKKNFFAYFAFVISLCIFIWIILEIPPNKAYYIGILKFPAVLIFFTDLYLSVFFFFYFLFSKRQGILIATFVSFYLLLRFAGLIHPLFLVITLGLLVTVELLFYKRK